MRTIGEIESGISRCGVPAALVSPCSWTCAYPEPNVLPMTATRSISWLRVFIQGVVIVGPELVPDSIAALETETRHD